MVGVSEDWAKKIFATINNRTYKLVGVSDWSSRRGTRITIELHVVEENKEGETELKDSKVLFSEEINEGKFLTGEFGSSDVWEIYGERFMQIFEEQKTMLEQSLKIKIVGHKIRILSHDAENYEIRLEFDGQEVEIRRVFGVPLPEKTSYEYTLETAWNEKTGEICWRDKAEEAYVNTYKLLKKYFGTPDHFTYRNSSDIGSKYTLRYKGHLFHIIINYLSLSINSDAPCELFKEFNTVFSNLVKVSQYDENALSKLIEVTRIRRPREYWEKRQENLLEKFTGMLSKEVVIDYWAFKPIAAIRNIQHDMVGMVKWTRNVGAKITIELHNYEESTGGKKNLIDQKILFVREIKDGRFVTGEFSKRDLWKMLGRRFRQLCKKQKNELETHPGTKVLEHEIKIINHDEENHVVELELDGQLVKIERVPDNEAKLTREGEFYGYKLEWLWDDVTGRPLGLLESLRMTSCTRFMLKKYFGKPVKLDSENAERFILKYKGYAFHVVTEDKNPIYSDSPHDICREFHIILCWLTREYRKSRHRN